MKRKIITIACIMLFLTTLIPLNGTAGDEENPEIEDKHWDVKLFGIIGGVPQRFFKSVDILSVVFYEDGDQPDMLYIALRLSDLSNQIEKFDVGYTVSWMMNHISYAINVHRFPSGDISSFSVGKSLEYNDDIIEWNNCEGLFDEEQSIITWNVPKEFIGNPSPFSRLTSLFSITFVRRIDDSGNPGVDLFKDLTYNAKNTNDYVIKY